MLSRVAILQAIKELPSDEQEELVNELFTLYTGIKEPPVTPHASRLAGIFSNGTIPPTDKDVARLIEEHRIGKYGQI